MQNFIVLGYVPGTHIQIDFTGWLILFVGFVLGTTLLTRWQQLRYRLVALRLARYIRQHQLA